MNRDDGMIERWRNARIGSGPVEERVGPRLDQKLRVAQVEPVESAKDDLPELGLALVREHVRVDCGDVVGGRDAAHEDDCAVALHQIRCAEDPAEGLDPLGAKLVVAHHQVDVRDRLSDDDPERARRSPNSSASSSLISPIRCGARIVESR